MGKTAATILVNANTTCCLPSLSATCMHTYLRCLLLACNCYTSATILVNAYTACCLSLKQKKQLPQSLAMPIHAVCYLTHAYIHTHIRCREITLHTVIYGVHIRCTYTVLANPRHTLYICYDPCRYLRCLLPYGMQYICYDCWQCWQCPMLPAALVGVQVVPMQKRTPPLRANRANTPKLGISPQLQKFPPVLIRLHIKIPHFCMSRYTTCHATQVCTKIQSGHRLAPFKFILSYI